MICIDNPIPIPEFKCPKCGQIGYDMRGFVYQAGQVGACFQWDDRTYQCQTLVDKREKWIKEVMEKNKCQT